MVSWDTEGTRAKREAEELSESAEGEAEKRRGGGGGGGGRAGTTCAAGARALLTDGDEDGDGRTTTPKKSGCDSCMICGVEGTLRVMALLAGEGDSVGERGVLLGAFILLNKKLGSISHFTFSKKSKSVVLCFPALSFRTSEFLVF